MEKEVASNFASHLDPERICVGLGLRSANAVVFVLLTAIVKSTLTKF